MVPLRLPEGRRFLIVEFPVDLDAPTRRIGLGLFMLGLTALMLAWLTIRWVIRPLEMASTAMTRVANGELGHRLPENSDVTGRIGETFNTMARQVQHLVEGQRTMMAAISHEIRTPLTRMRLQTELLKNSGANHSRIETLESDIDEINDLIGELVESARLKQGAIALTLQTITPTEIFNEVLGAIDVGDRQVAIQTTGASNFLGDRKRLIRAVANLVSNAARYTSSNTLITLDANIEDNKAHFSVSDNGDGVADSSLSQLFDPFYREEDSRSRATGGLGLGMMLVKQIIEAHGGGVHAENNEDGGLTVSFWIPDQRRLNTPQSNTKT